MITCPFCGENDFDLVGLKGHLLNSCEVFEQTKTPLQDIQERIRKGNARSKSTRMYLDNDEMGY